MRFLILTISCLMLVSPGFAEEIEGMSPTPPPVIVQEVGGNQASLAPAKYPLFSNFNKYWGGEETCVNYIQHNISEQSIPGRGNWSNILQKTINFNQLVGAEYNETASILIQWTVRAIGETPGFYFLWKSDNSGLCQQGGAGGWHGEVTQSYQGGDVQTRVRIPALSSEREFSLATMTLPALGASTAQTVYTPSDPTISGSVVVTADDFANGRIPAAFTIYLDWKNSTDLGIINPVDSEGNATRSIVVIINPLQLD